MKKLIVLSFITCCTLNSASAKIRRVGFFGSPVSGTDYLTFAAAYTAAAANDTIFMFPSTTLTGTISKKLYLIGPGNWLDPTSTPKGNANQQAFPGLAALGSVTFTAGSDGSVVTGFNGGTIYVQENNITITRNCELLVYVAYTSPAATVNNLQVTQNYRLNLLNYYTNGSIVSNMNVSNNLMTSFSTLPGNTYSGNLSNNIWAYDATQNAGNANGGGTTFSNNSTIELGGGAYLLQNNIFVCYYSTVLANNTNSFTFGNGGNTIFNYNLALQTNTATNWGTGTGNVTTPIGNAAAIFTAWPLIGATSADARYLLNAASPALTLGAGGTPIGMFAGPSPYKLSTIPTIPTIYALSSPQGNNPAGGTIQINVSTRGNN